MLRSGLVEQREHIAPATNVPIGRRGLGCAQSEQRLEGRHGLPTAIVPKHELVEVGLQLGAADTVVGPDQPLLEIADCAVGQGHHRPSALAERRPLRL